MGTSGLTTRWLAPTLITAMSETWLPGAERMQGPFWKSGYFGIPRRTMAQIEGEVNHSAEGPMGALLGEIMSPLEKSWTFSIGQDGRIVQHYSFESITWHAGVMGDLVTATEVKGNVALVGKEHAGVAGQKITGAQEDASVRITNFVREHSHAGSKPPQTRVSLWEHNWIKPGTACPSRRIDWTTYINKIAKEDDVALDAQDKKWLGGFGRGIVKMIAEGTVTSTLAGDPDYTSNPFNIKAVLAAGGGGLGGVPNADLAKIAKAVNDETSKRLQS